MATAQVSSEPSVGFPPKGSLRRVPFPRLIREVARRKLDGSLYLLSGQTKKVVFFAKGQPVFVRSNVLSECLGQILAQEGLITQEQCEQTLEAIRRTGKKQGELLVEMGILSEGNLRYGLEAQLRAKLFDIFSWEEGRYQFKDDAPELQFGITLKASAEGVIVEAIQDQYTEDRAGEALEAVAAKYPVLLDDAVTAAELVLLPEERHFLACLDGSRTVRELIEGADDSDVSSRRALLCGILLAGLIKLVDVAQPRRPWPAVPDFGPIGGTDEELRPAFEAQALITEYEDTPLPGELPQSPDLLGDHEDGFEGVGEDSGVVRLSAVMRMPELPEDLVAAEPASIEETFDDDELPEDSEVGSVPAGPPLLDAPAPDAAATAAEDDDAALDDLLAADDDDDGFSLDFEGDLPTAVEGPAPLVDRTLPPAVPEPVPLTGTMPTPTALDEPAVADEPEPIAPPLVDGAPQPVPPADTPAPPEPVAPLFAASGGTLPTTPLMPSPALSAPVMSGATLLAPTTSGATLLAPPTSGSGPKAPVIEPPVVASPGPAAPAAVEEELFDLAPDDDLLMLDDSVGAVAAGLLGPATGRGAPAKPAAHRDEPARRPLAAAGQDRAPASFDAEPIDDDALLEEVDDLELDELDDDLDLDEPEPAPRSATLRPSAGRAAAAQPERAAAAQPERAAAAQPERGADELLDFDDLDDIDLGGDEAAAPAAVAAVPSMEAVEVDEDDEGEGPEDMMAALRFNEGQAAIGDQRWDDAVVLLEQAYENGFDVAELHAMLAYARFQASGLDEQTAVHAFELLDYAQAMDPSLDLVHAYRGAIHRAQGDIPQAREALDRALELNPYCELAMEIMDAIG